MMFCALLFSTVYASDFLTEFEAAKRAFENKDFRLMEKHINQSTVLLAKHTSVITPQNLSDPWMLLAAAKYQEEKEPIWEFRNALILNPYLDWDDTYIQNNEMRDLFYAIKSEIEYREKTKTHVPEQYGLAKLYVDGVEIGYGSEVPRGEHLLQIKCPKGEVVSKWHTFAKNPKWLKMCPYKFDVTEMPDVKDEFLIEGIPPIFAEDAPQEGLNRDPVEENTQSETGKNIEEQTKSALATEEIKRPEENILSKENSSSSDIQTKQRSVEDKTSKTGFEESTAHQEKQSKEGTSEAEQSSLHEGKTISNDPTTILPSVEENTSSTIQTEDIRIQKLPRRLQEKYRVSGLSSDEWIQQQKIRNKGFSVQFYSGFSVGDVTRHYDARVGLTPEQEVYGVYEFESWISEGSGFHLGASVGYFPLWWLELSLYGGLAFYSKELSTGWEIQDSLGNVSDSDVHNYDPASSSMLHLEPRMRFYLLPSGTLKPYLLGGVFFRFFDSYDPPNLNNVTYSDHPGGVHFGVSSGVGLAIDSSSPVRIFLEIPYMQLVNALRYERLEISESTPNNSIKNHPYTMSGTDSFPISKNHIIALSFGLGFQFQ